MADPWTSILADAELRIEQDRELRIRQEISDALISGRKLEKWQRNCAYFFITGKNPPGWENSNRKRGAPKGSRTEIRNRNIEIFRNHMAGKTLKPTMLTESGYNSALRNGKILFWEQLMDLRAESKLRKSNLRKFMVGSVESKDEDNNLSTSDIEEMMNRLKKIGQSPRKRGWFRKT